MAAADGGWVAQEMPLETLAAATSDFAAASVIGEGSFGKVYRADVGTLAVRCAVKRLTAASEEGGIEQVWTEIRLLGSASCRHEGLLPLLGYCLDRRALI